MPIFQKPLLADMFQPSVQPPANAVDPGVFAYKDPREGMGFFQQAQWLAQNNPEALTALGAGIAQGNVGLGFAGMGEALGDYRKTDEARQRLSFSDKISKDWFLSQGFDEETANAAVNNEAVRDYLLKTKFKEQFPDDGTGSNGAFGNPIPLIGPKGEYGIGQLLKGGGIIDATTQQPVPQGWRPMSPTEIANDRSFGTGRGKNIAAIQQEVHERNANLPALLENTKKLKDLADTATQTIWGEGRDWVKGRMFGQDTEGGMARAAFESYLRGSVLPSLRATYGAQFTQVEGDNLVKTLSDPTAAPGTKMAAIDAFVENAETQLRAARAELESYGNPTNTGGAGAGAGAYGGGSGAGVRWERGPDGKPRRVSQ